MDGTKIIRQMLEETKVSIKSLSELSEMNYQTLRNKLNKNNFSFEEIQKIANVLGYEIKAVKCKRKS